MANVGRCAAAVGASGLLLLLIVLNSQTAVAQNPPAWLQFTMVQVEPAMVDEYVALQKEIATRIRRGGPAWRTVSRTDGFGDSYRFVILSPVQNLASLDAAARNTDAELASLNSRAQKYVRSQQTFAIRTIPEIDNPLPANQQPALMIVNMAKVFPGREQDYLNVMKADFLPHFNKESFRHMNGSVSFGGETGYMHLFFINNFAKLDEGSPVLKALGAAGAQTVAAKFSGIVSSNEQWIVRVIPDLSYGGWSPAQTRP
jgi:hypothetical protein